MMVGQYGSVVQGIMIHYTYIDFSNRMRRGRIMVIAKRLWKLAYAVAAFVGHLIGILASASEPSKRAQHEGTDLTGEYNFRTNKIDAGTDPYGWYEEDM